MSAETRNRAASYATRPTGAPPHGPGPAGDGDGRAGQAADVRALPELLRELTHEGRDLVRQEVALARSEVMESVEELRRSLTSMAIGGGVLLIAALPALWAVTRGLTALMDLFLPLGVAVWLAPLLLAAVLAAVGWSVLARGKRRMQETSLTPRRTRETLEEDKRWAKEKARDVKEEIKHG